MYVQLSVVATNNVLVFVPKIKHMIFVSLADKTVTDHLRL